MIRLPIKRTTYIFLQIFSVVLFVLLYCWLSHRQHVFNPKDTTIPNLSQFIEGWKKIITPSLSGEVWLWEDLFATYGRHFSGLLLGIVLSLFVGIGMGCFVSLEAFFLPALSFFAKIPPTAMMAVYFVLFGTGTNLYIAMIALSIFPTLTQAIYQAAKKDVSQYLVDKAYTLGASNFEVIFEVIYKQILPRIIESIRLQVGPAMVMLIAAEWMMSDVGFGYRLRIQSRLLNMNVVYIYLVILGASGYLMDSSLSLVRRKLCPWFGE